jgi:hypothetical protein
MNARGGHCRRDRTNARNHQGHESSRYDRSSSPPALLFFDQPERALIPVFSGRKAFDEEADGTGFEGQAVSVSAAKFASLLHGDEIVILNSGHRPAIEFRASDLKALANPP